MQKPIENESPLVWAVQASGEGGEEAEERKEKEGEGKNDEKGKQREETADSESEDMSVAVEEHCTECDLEEDTSLSYQFQHYKTGVPVTNRRYRFRTYEKVFVGQEAVTWLSSNLKVGREEALKAGRELQEEGLFTHVNGKHLLKDEFQLYRFAKHDPKRKLKPSDVDSSKPFHLSVHGFRGCPFCARAIEFAHALDKEVADSSKLVIDAVEHDNRVAFKKFLVEKRKAIAAKGFPSAVYHTASPICYTTDEDQYIGGLDDMLLLLAKVPTFKNTAAVNKYKPESPFKTFITRIPSTVKNITGSLPF